MRQDAPYSTGPELPRSPTECEKCVDGKIVPDKEKIIAHTAAYKSCRDRTLEEHGKLLLDADLTYKLMVEGLQAWESEQISRCNKISTGNPDADAISQLICIKRVQALSTITWANMNGAYNLLTMSITLSMEIELWDCKMKNPCAM